MVRVDDVDQHHEHAMQEWGADTCDRLLTFRMGNGSITLRISLATVWTFSQSIADVAPEEWGGTSR